jgi:succinate dehydrogenase / fumarate reductase membrane anchor subunit
MLKDKSNILKSLVDIAHFGFRDWLAQRISAIILAIYTVIFIFALIILRNDGYLGWSNLFSEFWMKISSVLAVLALCYHAWVGVRDIWMDYIKPVAVRLSLQVFSILWLLGCGLWAIIILWKV